MSTTRKYGGTGLGLAIGQRLTRLMEGELTLRSTPGEGTVAQVDLPVRRQGRTPVVAETVVHPGIRGGVLVIDDDAWARDLLVRTLRDAGMAVASAPNGHEGLALARSMAPRAILLDVLMPEMDGWEVLRRLQSDPRTAGVPVVVVSMTREDVDAEALGVHRFVTKPIDRVALVDLLREMQTTYGWSNGTTDRPGNRR